MWTDKELKAAALLLRMQFQPFCPHFVLSDWEYIAATILEVGGHTIKQSDYDKVRKDPPPKSIYDDDIDWEKVKNLPPDERYRLFPHDFYPDGKLCVLEPEQRAQAIGKCYDPQ